MLFLKPSNKKGFVEDSVNMVVGIIIALAVAVFLIAALWPEMSEEILELNTSNEAAADNLTAIQTTIPEELNDLVGIFFVVITLIVLLAVYGVYRKYARA